MQHLVTRLTLTMLGLAVVTAAVIALSVPLGSYLYFQGLPAEVRAGLESRINSPSESVYRDAFRGFRLVQTYSLLVGALLSALVTVGFARFLAGVLSKPFEQVSAAAEQVTRGNLSARVREPEKLKTLEVVTLTQTFNQMAQTLETYEGERRDMIASIAHDLRTPLSAIQIRLELLKERVVPYSDAEVDLLLGQTELLGRLVGDLRTLSLADAGKLSLDLQGLELGALVQNVLKSYAFRAEEKSVRLLFDAPTSDVWLTADAQRLTQVLGNLLDNALRATPAGGAIRLTLQEQDGVATLSVADDGPGIAADLLPQIFDRFVQGKDTTGSSGLGLAIVKTLVELHHGSVSASNRAEGGASFTLTFPV